MWVPFEELAPESRVWINQSDRKLTGGEQAMIVETMKDFCAQWAAHGTPLKCSFKVDHDHFLILGVDEAWSGASGCSIDSSVRVIKAIGEQLNVDFFGRTSASFLTEKGVVLVPLKNIREALADGILTPATPAFHTLAATKKEMDESWTLPLERTWLSKYLPNPALA